MGFGSDGPPFFEAVLCRTPPPVRSAQVTFARLITSDASIAQEAATQLCSAKFAKGAALGEASPLKNPS